MRHLVTVQKIADIQPIEGADAIEKAKVKEWWVVIKKDSFKVGDPCVFYEIDSFLPIKPEYEFLLKGNHPKKMLVDGQEREGIRLKTIKLRGQISQGLVLPVPEGIPQQIDYDCTEELGVIKFELPISVQLSGLVKGAFPSFIPKTDEERIQNCAHLLEQFKGEEVYITSKLDGCSATFFKKDGEFGVCSRNLELKDSDGNTFWHIARQYDLMNKIPDNHAIQGEIIGEGIQKNPLKINKQKLYVYNVYDIQKGEYKHYNDFVKMTEELGLERVPEISKQKLDFTIDSVLSFATAPSPLNPEVLQEGIVIRPLEEKTASIGGVLTRLSFKAISNEYLLKNEE